MAYIIDQHGFETASQYLLGCSLLQYGIGLVVQKTEQSCAKGKVVGANPTQPTPIGNTDDLSIVNKCYGLFMMENEETL